MGSRPDVLMWQNSHMFQLDIQYFGEQFTSVRIVGLWLLMRMLFHYQNTSLCTSEQAPLRPEKKIAKKDHSSASEV